MKNHRSMASMVSIFLALLIIVIGSGCGDSGKGAATISEAKERHTPELMSIPGVVGVGIGGTADEEIIVVYLENDSPGLKARIPTELEGYEVTAEVTGTIKPL